MPLAAALLAPLLLAAGRCPPGTAEVDSFDAEGKRWSACEDLATPGGAVVLVPESEADGETAAAAGPIWLPKSYEPYNQGTDDDYYYGLGKETVLHAKWDMLGDAVINQCATKTSTTKLCEPTWARVEKAIPVMRYSQGNKHASGNQFMCSPYSPESGVRTFTGSRSASVDATFSDHADDCTDNGFPRPQGYVMNLTAIADGEPAIIDFTNYVNFTAMAEGLVGAVYPNLIFYFPIITQNFTGFGGSRYWTMIASPVADMEGGREQSVWFRFQQVICEGDSMAPPCKLHGKPQYYDTYWYSFSPITDRWIRPELMANASGFYGNMLKVKRYWDAELAAEGMMEVQLPATPTTNGTWLAHQSVFSFVRSMISRDNTWHPRYGVIPGYGITLQDGFQDTFTSTATAALEWGSLPYARGVIDNWIKYYVRTNGMTTYRAEELAQSGRMLTIFALYTSYTGDTDFMLGHFEKAKVLAEWLLYRYNASLTNFPVGDPRHGIVEGGDEGDGFVAFYETYGKTPLSHAYSCTSNTYRGFMEIGQMWKEIGHATGRNDISAHAGELLDVAPKILAALHVSLNKTIQKTANPRAPICIPSNADPSPAGSPAGGCLGDFRGYNELMYTGALTYEQADNMFIHLTYGNESQLVTRPMTLGATGYNNKQVTYTAYGMAYGLLQHDMIERFLLHYFGMSAHTYTRATWTTPEAAHPDRDVGSTDYVAAGVHTAPTYMKWMLLFEEPNTKIVWVGKALPREWLGAGVDPVVVSNATTRYGRVSYSMSADTDTAADAAAPFTVTASVSLPATFAGPTGPAGGVRVRMRTPLKHVGKMSTVTVGGKLWTKFDANAETVNFGELTPALLEEMKTIAVTFKA